MSADFRALCEEMLRKYESLDRAINKVGDIEAANPETGDCLTDRYGYAAEIRALQRHILPDEPALSEEESRDPIILSTYRQRHRLRELLLEEADRAEESR